MKPVLIVHGGAWDIPENTHKAHLNGILRALETGCEVLKKCDSALETVLKTIRYLESDPTFDAGKGSFLNAAGEVEMDAGIMVGKDLTAGAVAAIQQVEHPISVAEFIRRETQHVMLVGQGATTFAHQNGFKPIDTEQLLVGRERKLYYELQKKTKVRIKSFFENKSKRGDTVGAVAIDSKGAIVAGTSTGGTPFKLPGRVGDSPIIGSGFFADDRMGGASSTGWGEGILRVMLARTAVEYLNKHPDIQMAVREAIQDLKNKVSGEGGVIMIDHQGRWAFDHNTPYMAVGVADSERIHHISMGNRSVAMIS